MAVVIGLDLGTSGVKALAVDERGNVCASAVADYPLHSPQPNWAEQDAEDWRRASFQVLAQVAQEVRKLGHEVRAIGLTGQMHGSVFLDAQNRVIRPPILWCDQRTATQCEHITETVGDQRLLAMVSNPALTGFTAPKILWLRDNEPENYRRVQHVLLPKDYIRFLLTGEYATDVADASGTLLFDVTHRCWHRELLDILEIPYSWMPPAFEGPEITGRLRGDVAEMLGLPEGLPVVAGGGDQAANGVGCGIVRRGVVSASLGTSGVVFAFSEDVHTDPEGRVHTFCHAVPGTWHIMGVMLSAGGALRWFRDALCDTEIREAKERGVDPYEIITEEAAGVPLGSEGLIFLPYLTGERTPHKDPYAKGAFIGLSLRHSRAHMARAVLEGVAYGMRESFEIIQGMGVPVAASRVSGGGARSALWRQMMADIAGVPMVRINVEEGPAFGAALLASVAAGFYNDVVQACDAVLEEVERHTPHEDSRRRYSAWFTHYREAYRALAPSFRRMTETLNATRPA
jgi:xylulokinase